MKHKQAKIFIIIVLLLVSLLSGCGGRRVDLDTDAFNGTTHEGTGDQVEEQDLAQMLASGQAVQYDRAVLNDPLLGCEVARTLMPQGWISGGEVGWNGQSGIYPAVYHFFVGAPDNTAVVGMVSGCSYIQPDTVNSWDAWEIGKVMVGSLDMAKMLLTPSEYNLELISGLFIMQNPQIVDTKYPEGEEAQEMERIRQQMQEATDAFDAQVNSYGNLYTSSICSVRAEECILTFEMNGQSWKASVFSLQLITENTLQSVDGYLPTKTEIRWEVPVLLYYIAQEDVYEQYEQEAKSLFLGNFVRNQQWDGALNQACEQAFANEANRQAEQWQQTQQIIQQQAAAISASMQQNYSSYGSSGGSSGYDTDVMGGWTNAITGNSYYEGPDGGHVLLDSGQYHYTDGSSIYSSDEPMNIGGTNLSPLTDLGTMGGD